MKKNTIYFSKVKPKAIIPNKKIEDAGYDIYCCFDEQELVINSGEIVIIPTGIATAFPKEYVLVIKERSSTGALGMSTRMGIIDSGYRGELFIGINNTSQKKIIISKNIDSIQKTEKTIYYPYTKAISQGLYLLLPELETTEIEYNELLAFESSRMSKKLGDSGK